MTVLLRLYNNLLNFSIKIKNKKGTFWKLLTCILDHPDSEFSSENEDDFPTKSTAKTKKTGKSSKPEVAKSSTSASGIFDDQDQKDDSEEYIETEEPFEKNEEFGPEIEIETKKGNSFLSELSSKISDPVKSKKKDQEKIIEEDNKSIKSNISSKSIKSNVSIKSKSLFDSDSDDDLFTAR